MLLDSYNTKRPLNEAKIVERPLNEAKIVERPSKA
jgi:hypothetical protein